MLFKFAHSLSRSIVRMPQIKSSFLVPMQRDGHLVCIEFLKIYTKIIYFVKKIAKSLHLKINMYKNLVKICKERITKIN